KQRCDVHYQQEEDGRAVGGRYLDGVDQTIKNPDADSPGNQPKEDIPMDQVEVKQLTRPERKIKQERPVGEFKVAVDGPAGRELTESAVEVGSIPVNALGTGD